MACPKSICSCLTVSLFAHGSDRLSITEQLLVWAPLALPVLKLVQPRMHRGAVVIVDNTISSASRYKDLLEYLRASGSGFTNLTLPYTKGLEMSVYMP